RGVTSRLVGPASRARLAARRGGHPAPGRPILEIRAHGSAHKLERVAHNARTAGTAGAEARRAGRIRARPRANPARAQGANSHSFGRTPGRSKMSPRFRVVVLVLLLNAVGCAGTATPAPKAAAPAAAPTAAAAAPSTAPSSAVSPGPAAAAPRSGPLSPPAV